MIPRRLLIFVPLVALLAACGEEAPSDDSRSASGEVLEGTISDAMLPLDTVQSEPPFEDPEAAEAVQQGAAADADVAAEAGETAAEPADAAAEEAPAAEPSPEPAD